MLGKGHGGLYKAPAKEERRQKVNRRETDKTSFIDSRLESGKVVGFGKGR